MLNETIFMEATILVKVRMLADIVGHDQRGGPVDRLLTCFTRARQRSEHLAGNECPGLEVFTMSESTAVTAEVRLLDGGYSHETRSLLYHAYRREPTFAYLFEAARPGYDHRIRATVRAGAAAFLSRTARVGVADRGAFDWRCTDCTTTTSAQRHGKLGLAYTHVAEHRVQLHAPLPGLPGGTDGLPTH